MSLLDNVKKEVGIKAEPTGAKKEAESTTVETGAKKKSNSDYQKRARAKALESAQLIKAELASKKVELSDKAKEALAYLCKEGGRTSSSNFGTPVFERLFGAEAKVGDKVTALKVFETTGKGFAEMRKLMKQWKEKQNTVVDYDSVAKAYVIKSL